MSPTCTPRRSRASPTCRGCSSGRPGARPRTSRMGRSTRSRTTTSRAARGPCGSRRRPSSSGSAADPDRCSRSIGRRTAAAITPSSIRATASVSHDDIPIDARRIPAYFQRAMTDPSHDGLIRLRLRDHVVSAYAASEGWPIVEADDSFQLLAGVSRGTRAILVGPRHLIELNMERIARAVYSGASRRRRRRDLTRRSSCLAAHYGFGSSPYRRIRVRSCSRLILSRCAARVWFPFVRSSACTSSACSCSQSEKSSMTGGAGASASARASGTGARRQQAAQFGRADGLLVTEDHQPLGEILELPHVAGPAMGAQAGERLRREPARRRRPQVARRSGRGTARPAARCPRAGRAAAGDAMGTTWRRKNRSSRKRPSLHFVGEVPVRRGDRRGR